MKRFYKLVSLYEKDCGYGIHLDGKPVKTPAGRILLCQNEILANEVMLEWAAQEKNIRPDTMPVNQIVITALDTLQSPSEIKNHILGYIDTDLVFYRSDISPYKEQQNDKWGKWTSWFEKEFSVNLKMTGNLTPLRQEDKVKFEVQSYLATLTGLQLVLFDSLIEDTSSPVLVMAFFKGAATAEDLYQAVLLEDLIKAEIYDETTYGAAPDQEKKRKKIKASLEAATKILSAL